MDSGQIDSARRLKLQGHAPDGRPQPETHTVIKSISRIFAAAVVVVALVTATPSRAATATSNLGVSATVSANCTISTAAVAFGAYDPVSANAASAQSGTGTVTVTCTSGSAATITLGQGANAEMGSTDAAPLRRMSNGASSFLSYGLYQDAGLTSVWGNTAETDVAHLGTGSSTALTVYGSIPSGQNVPAGSYTDTVIATVTF